MKAAWSDVRHHVHKLDKAMKESRLTPQIAALTESFFGDLHAAKLRRNAASSEIDDHVTSALAHADKAKNSTGYTRDINLHLCHQYVNKALASKAAQPYHSEHPLYV